MKHEVTIYPYVYLVLKLITGDVPGSDNSDTSVPKLRWGILRNERAVVYYVDRSQRSTHPDLNTMPRSFRYCPCSLIVTQQHPCVSVMGQTVSRTPCSFVDVVGLLDTALQLHDIKCYKAAASQIIVCGEMLLTMLRRLLATESCAEKVCIGGQVWV